MKAYYGEPMDDIREFKEQLYPEEKAYSVVLFDRWKPPRSEGFADKITEVEDLSEIPNVTLDKGEELVIYDSDGNFVDDRKPDD